jgi:hypothetical protein
MPSKPLTRLTALIATLALALAAPVALAHTHHSACTGHAGPRAGHATHACAHTPTATKPQGRHKGGAHHVKHTAKHGRAQAPHHTSEAQATSCEDGSTPLVASGEATCADGSEPSCVNGADPVAGASGALTCPVVEASQQDSEACEAEACTFDSEGPESPEEG